MNPSTSDTRIGASGASRRSPASRSAFMRWPNCIAKAVVLLACALSLVQCGLEPSQESGEEPVPLKSAGRAGASPWPPSPSADIEKGRWKEAKAASNRKPAEIEVFGEVRQESEPWGKRGEPIANATIHVDTEIRSVRQANTDASGLFRIFVPVDKLQTIRVEAPGFAGAQQSRELILRRVSRPDNPRRFFLDPGVEVSSRVVVNDQSPLENASVQCVRSSHNGMPKASSSVLSDANGAFTVICPIARVKLLGMHPDYQHGVTDWIDLKEVREPFPSIELKRGTRLYGRVLGEDGRPAAKAALNISDLDERVAFHAWRESRLYLMPLPYWRLSQADGSFDYGHLSGHLQLRASVDDGAVAVVEVDLGDQDEQYVEMKLDPGVTVSGRATLDGEPVSNVMVAWGCDPARMKSPKVQLTNENGAFILKQVTARKIKDVSKCNAVAIPAQERVPWWAKQEAIGGFQRTQASALPGADDVVLELRSVISE